MRLFNLLMCKHEHLSWPRYNRQICFDCAMERYYSLKTMKRGKWESPKLAPELVQLNSKLQERMDWEVNVNNQGAADEISV